MGYERRRRTRRGQFVPRLLRLESLRRANLSQTKSRHSQVVASREEKPNLRTVASLAWNQLTKASWQVTICRGVSWAVNCSRPRSEAPPSFVVVATAAARLQPRGCCTVRAGASWREIAARLGVGIGTVHSAAQGTLQRPFANSP